jgi:NADP-dependent 3-hydroxy acid dehydrogenase YdfG
LDPWASIVSAKTTLTTCSRDGGKFGDWRGNGSLPHRQRGWSVIALARRADRLEQLRTDTGCDVVVADVTQDSDVDALRDYVESTGGVSALVNNAGGAVGIDWIDQADADDWAQMFDVNVLGVQRVTKALLPALRRASAELGVADIVTISSTAAFLSYEGGAGYTAAKAAVHSMLVGLRLELSGEPLRVVEIAPGMVKTEEFALNRFGGDAARVLRLSMRVLRLPLLRRTWRRLCDTPWNLPLM